MASDPITLVRWRDAKTDPPRRATYPVWTDLGDAYYHPETGEWHETPDTPYAMDPQPWMWAEDADPLGDDPLTVDDVRLLAALVAGDIVAGVTEEGLQSLAARLRRAIAALEEA